MLASFPTSELPTTLQTVEEFEQWERHHPHEGSYEFVRGRILPKGGISQNKFDLVDFISRRFIATEAFRSSNDLLPRIDVHIDAYRKRTPDMTYITVEQRQAIRRGERVNTLFAIEILSDSETHEEVLEKIAERGPQDYFDGGTQLVWYIVPKRQQIYAYTSPVTLHVYTGSDTVSAAPVLPDLTFALPDLFA